MAVVAPSASAQWGPDPCRGLSAEGCTSVGVAAVVPLTVIGAATLLQKGSTASLALYTGALLVGPATGFLHAGMPEEAWPGLAIRAGAVAGTVGLHYLLYELDSDSSAQIDLSTAVIALVPGLLVYAWSLERDVDRLFDRLHEEDRRRVRVGVQPLPDGAAATLQIRL